MAKKMSKKEKVVKPEASVEELLQEKVVTLSEEEILADLKETLMDEDFEVITKPRGKKQPEYSLEMIKAFVRLVKGSQDEIMKKKGLNGVPISVSKICAKFGILSTVTTKKVIEGAEHTIENPRTKLPSSLIDAFENFETDDGGILDIVKLAGATSKEDASPIYLFRYVAKDENAPVEGEEALFDVPTGDVPTGDVPTSSEEVMVASE